MNSFISLFQWILNVTPALTAQLLLILIVVKPAHRWFGSNFAFRLWLLPFLWLPLSLALSTGINSFVKISGPNSNSFIPATSSLIANFSPTEAAIWDNRIFYIATDSEATDLWLIATSVWLGVIAILITTQIARSVSLRIYLSKENRHTPSEKMSPLVTSAGFPRELPIKVVSNLASPALYGITHRTLLLPVDFDKQFDTSQMLMILRHEYSHYCRNDNLVNCAFLLCGILFWFNPIIWIAFKRFKLDQELVCDSAALSDSNHEQRGRYAEAFLNSFKGRKLRPSADLANWGESRGAKERALMLSKHHTHTTNGSRKILVLGLMLIIGTTSSSYLRSQVRAVEDKGMLQAETIPDEILEELNDYDRSTVTALEIENRSAELVPADSEYIAFILDTSGSMANTPGSWQTAQDQIIDVLGLYPDLVGFQIVNDMGVYLFNEFRSEWIPPTPERIAALSEALLYWRPYSNSSPVEGMAEVLNNLVTNYSDVSVYIIGDDVQQEILPSAVLENINRYNQPISSAGYIARIHAIMLPNIFMGPPRFREGAYKFANLMRAVTGRNGGSFTLLEY